MQETSAGCFALVIAMAASFIATVLLGFALGVGLKLAGF